MQQKSWQKPNAVAPTDYNPKDTGTKKVKHVANPMSSRSHRNFDKYLKNRLMDVPGPGKYTNIDKAKTGASIKMSKDKRMTVWGQKEKTPGPGNYKPSVDPCKPKTPNATIKLGRID